MLDRRPRGALPRTLAGALAVGVSLGAFVGLVMAPGTASAAPVVIGTSVANSLAGLGQGLCVANAISTAPATDFPQMADVYNSGINAFMEMHVADRVQYVQRTIFDLSNNQDTGPKISWGDFTNSMLPQCEEGGCGFNWNDTTTSFASRFRGFINITGQFVNQPFHIGFYSDDAVSLTVFDKSGNAYAVMTQPPVLGAATWRLTETVTFVEPGLYPIEILYAQIVEHAALEMSYFFGTFTDFQQGANTVPITSLSTAGFTLFPESAFFQTLSGEPSYPSLDQCKQCDRQFVGQFGNNGCDGGYYCNEAALCAPCDSAIYCGPSCSPCGGMTPFCINTNGQLACGECLVNTDCKAGYTCDNHTCIPPVQCNVDADCGRGEECIAHVCQWCSEANKCAGNSCNCCGNGANGKPMTCAVLPGDALPDGGTLDGGSDGGLDTPPPECVECQGNADCSGGQVCDPQIGQCVPSINPNEQPSCCGPSCDVCPATDPLCLPGPFGTACAACRNDLECPAGNFCIEGQCSLCTSDRHCGARCQQCAGDTPFCLTTQVLNLAACVRCNTDDQCGTGAKCDTTTHDCTPGCNMTCGAATPYCDGTTCVACYADTQCPCNGTCDLTTHACSPSCASNADCLGDQHCQHADDGSNTETCQPGPLPDNADCGGTLADLCGGSSIGSRGGEPTPSRGVLAVALGALVLRRLRRRRSGTSGASSASGVRTPGARS